MTRALALAAVAALVAGCGGHQGKSRPDLIVTAASSLTAAFTRYAAHFGGARVRLSFGGSDELAAQIGAGGRADIYAAANTTLPQQLFHERRVSRPVEFTANRLVLAVPSRGGRVHSLADVAQPGVKLVVGAPSVPAGAYARQVLARLGPGERARILANVRSEEPDVAGIVGKLTQGAADAGFVYATDVAATRGALRAIHLPRRLQPTVVYAAAVVTRSAHPAAARAFVRGLLNGRGRDALRRAGFVALP